MPATPATRRCRRSSSPCRTASEPREGGDLTRTVSKSKPSWSQATALVSLSTCGAVTGFTFAPGTVADVTSPASMPLHLLAADQPDGPDAGAADAGVTGTSAAGSV